jgi:hypothetical protein
VSTKKKKGVARQGGVLGKLLSKNTKNKKQNDNEATRRMSLYHEENNYLPNSERKDQSSKEFKNEFDMLLNSLNQEINSSAPSQTQP